MIAANSACSTQDAVVFAALPLFHVNALVVTAARAAVQGPAGRVGRARWATATRRCSRSFWKIVEHYRIAAMSAVPTVYAVLAELPGRRRHQQPALRHGRRVPAAAGGPGRLRGRTPASRLVEGYGLTEATCVSARSFPDAPRPGSVGQRLPYQQVQGRAGRRRR